MNALAANEERDLLPWILSALLAVFAAFAIAVGTRQPGAAPNLHAPGRPATARAAPVSDPMPAPVMRSSAVTVPPIEAPKLATLPAGQIWECTGNGQRTFSNSPCGPNASIRQLNALNTMQASPILASPWYEPAPPDAPNYTDDNAPSSENRTIVVLGRNALYDNRRYEHRPPRHGGARISLRSH
jgi:hypothetical protein